jgi:glycosyltransferase involved in cell wall biosynthesis
MARIALVHDVAGVAAVQAQLLRTAGHEVDQIALPDIGATWRWPAKALALPIRLASYLPTVRRLRSGNYDVVHVHWLSHGIVGVLAGRHFFAQAHGSDLHLNLNNVVYRAVTRRVLQGATKVFYVTPNLRSYLKDVEEKLVYLPNPVDMRGVGQPYPAPTEVSRIVVFTRLDPVKGVEKIFPAVERLSVHAEVTAFDWGSLSRDYKKRYGTWVRFVKPVPHGDIGEFLSQFDVAIGQMRQGILSLMEVEALAAGRPLITAIDWKLYAEDRPPVVPAFDADQIVTAVDDLRTSPERLAELSRDGRDWALRNHSYPHHLDLLQAAYFGVGTAVAPTPATASR